MNATTVAGKRFRWLCGAILAGLLGCAPPSFLPEGPFARPLGEFRRIHIRPVRVELASPSPTREQVQGAELFAIEFRKALVHRLHRKGLLDAPEGPTLLLDVRIVRYEWEVVPGGADLPPRTDSRIDVAVTFRDEAGSTIGTGSVAATGAGSAPRFSLENSEKAAISSIYTFIRKSLRRKTEADAPETPDAEIVPLP
jgi:hypothetical protein